MEGFSGSPVYVYTDDEPFGETTRLLGLTWCHFQHDSNIQNTGITAVVPVWKILELVHQENVMERRANTAEKMEGGKMKWVGETLTMLDSASDDTPGPEPERLKADGSLDEVAKRVIDAGKPEADAHED